MFNKSFLLSWSMLKLSFFLEKYCCYVLFRNRTRNLLEGFWYISFLVWIGRILSLFSIVSYIHFHSFTIVSAFQSEPEQINPIQISDVPSNFYIVIKKCVVLYTFQLILYLQAFVETTLRKKASWRKLSNSMVLSLKTRKHFRKWESRSLS